ncbi:transporter substrate-binding domain-containing protein [Kamptonema cortianum]|nr:transporter substrate-binding domain-containing protein [Oscillatoria laete-virens]MDK3159493.1 transporter substrate-binding domain-containing protein [Kamptonema cortianum]MDL5053033.1 transporter substrate-binding domain-containing protein [Oscillatoria laete-virens NRMC-F 0139]
MGMTLSVCPGQTPTEKSALPDRPLTVGVVRLPPYAMQAPNAQWTGIGPELWRELARKLDVEYEFREMTLHEALDALKNGKIDFLATPISVVFEREKFCDFTIPIFTTGVDIARPESPKTHIWINALKLFFRWQVLEVVAYLLAILVILGTIVYFIECRHNPEYFGKGFFNGIGAGIYWVGAVLTSGVCIGVAIKSLPGRIIALLWMFVSVIAISTLTASLASILTNQKLAATEIRLDTFRKYKIGAIQGGISEGYLKAFDLKVSAYTSANQGIHDVAEGKLDAFVGDDLVLEYLVKKYHLDDQVDLIPVKNLRNEVSFAMPVDSPLRKTINLTLLEILSEPSWQNIKDRYINQVTTEPQGTMRRPRRN